MVAPAVMTYDSLNSDVLSYTERPTDANLIAQLPRLIMLAENRITADLRILGTQQVVVSAFTPGLPTLAKPARWRRTISFNFTDADGERHSLKLRSYELVRQFWPNAAETTVLPKYYADYNFDNLLIAGTPATDMAFEMLYVARLQPLGDAYQVNWLTENAPQLLLAATLLETEVWLKNASRIALRQAAYDSALGALVGEDKSRLADRGAVVS